MEPRDHPVDVPGREVVVAAGAVPQNFDDFTVAVEGVRDEGDTVVISAHFRGRNKSGAELDAHAEHVQEVRDRKIVRCENKVDQEAWARGWS